MYTVHLPTHDFLIPAEFFTDGKITTRITTIAKMFYLAQRTEATLDDIEAKTAELLRRGKQTLEHLTND